MVYDPAGKIIGFGGETTGGRFQGDTWELAQHNCGVGNRVGRPPESPPLG